MARVYRVVPVCFLAMFANAAFEPVLAGAAESPQLPPGRRASGSEPDRRRERAEARTCSRARAPGPGRRPGLGEHP